MGATSGEAMRVPGPAHFLQAGSDAGDAVSQSHTFAISKDSLGPPVSKFTTDIVCGNSSMGVKGVGFSMDLSFLQLSSSGYRRLRVEKSRRNSYCR